jgi:alpha(1,3/1,4) fucosyltransferase
LTKPPLRLGFTDYFYPMDEFFTYILSEVYNVVRDDRNPDYLIFSSEDFGRSNESYTDPRIVRIFYTGENRRPWGYKAHHAITFDHLDGPHFYRMPIYVMDNWVYTQKYGLPDIRDKPRIGVTSAKEKEGFCSFVVRNPSCPQRNNMFYKLSEYKQVTSGGALFNNIGGELSRDPVKFHTDKFEFLSKFKFNLCYENSSWPGYATEKIYHAFYCNTIPIYWGSPTVEMDFNIRGMISRHEFDSDEQMIDCIKEIDNDDDLYDGLISSSALNWNNKTLGTSKFLNWFSQHVYKGPRQ